MDTVDVNNVATCQQNLLLNSATWMTFHRIEGPYWLHELHHSNVVVDALNFRSCTANGSRDVDIVVARRAGSGGGGDGHRGGGHSEPSAAPSSPAASSTPTSTAAGSTAAATADEQQQPLSLLARHDEEVRFELKCGEIARRGHFGGAVALPRTE